MPIDVNGTRSFLVELPDLSHKSVDIRQRDRVHIGEVWHDGNENILQVKAMPFLKPYNNVYNKNIYIFQFLESHEKLMMDIHETMVSS